MGSRIWLVNILMAGVLVFAGISAWDAWLRELKEIPGMDSKSSGGGAQELKKSQTVLFAEQKYDLLVDQNLFSPKREEYVPSEDSGDEAPPEPEVPEEPDVRISGERVVLYGVVITRGKKTALINNPGGKLGEGEYQWIKEGQALANLKVEAINPKGVVLDDGGQKYQISLMEKKDRKPRGQPDKKGGPTVVSGGHSSKTSSSVSGSSGSDRGTAGRGSKKHSTSSASSDSGSKEAEYETISTPFGKIKRRIK